MMCSYVYVRGCICLLLEFFFLLHLILFYLKLRSWSKNVQKKMKIKTFPLNIMNCARDISEFCFRFVFFFIYSIALPSFWSTVFPFAMRIIITLMVLSILPSHFLFLRLFCFFSLSRLQTPFSSNIMQTQTPFNSCVLR